MISLIGGIFLFILLLFISLAANFLIWSRTICIPLSSDALSSRTLSLCRFIFSCFSWFLSGKSDFLYLKKAFMMIFDTDVFPVPGGP